MGSSSGESQWTLWYKEPAEQWVEALPVGNGRLGAMVFGGIDPGAHPVQRGYGLDRSPARLCPPRRMPSTMGRSVQACSEVLDLERAEQWERGSRGPGRSGSAGDGDVYVPAAGPDGLPAHG